jgi:hypothetical protein
MSECKPLALQLADKLRPSGVGWSTTEHQAADELVRLYWQNKALWKNLQRMTAWTLNLTHMQDKSIDDIEFAWSNVGAEDSVIKLREHYDDAVAALNNKPND